MEDRNNRLGTLPLSPDYVEIGLHLGFWRRPKQLVSEILPPNEYEKKLLQIDDDGAKKLKQSVSEFPLPFATL